MRAVRSLVFVAAALLLASGCSTPKRKMTRVPKPTRPNYERPLPPGMMALEKIVNPAELPYLGHGFDDRAGLVEAVDRSLAYFAKPSSKKYYPYLDISHERAKGSLVKFKEVLQASTSPTQFHEEIIRQFDVYRSVGYNGQGVVLFTGYCEPIYEGSLEPTPVYRYALYRLPKDLVKDPEGTPLGRRTPAGETVPYYTRKEIEEQNLLKGQELIYLKDRLEAYIVHIQGSARIKLPDGRLYPIGYAGKTDRPYVSVGQELIKDGKLLIADLSLQRVKDYFAQHPTELSHYLHRNQSFVFFTPSEGGPYGSIGVQVTPFRSLATDKTVFPRGCLGYVETRIPVLGEGINNAQTREFRSFVLDQDTGGAIRSAGRADLFLGTGPEAEFLAGRTQAEGRLFYVFVKEDPKLSQVPASPATKTPAAAATQPPRTPVAK